MSLKTEVQQLTIDAIVQNRIKEQNHVIESIKDAAKHGHYSTDVTVNMQFWDDVMLLLKANNFIISENKGEPVAPNFISLNIDWSK